MKSLVAVACIAAAVSGARAAEADAADNINNYLVDITGGAVSASGLIGLDKGVKQIETSQDIIVALQPLSTDGSRAAFGLAITPARTTILPMAGATYVKNAFNRLIGSLTLSYAQNTTEVASVSYRKHAFSLDTIYYFDIADDPVKIGNTAFNTCLSPDLKKQNADDINAIVTNRSLSGPGRQAALEALTAKLNDTLTGCIDAEIKAKTRWNAGRAALSYGEGRIRAPGADSTTLGRSLTLNLQYPAGDKGVAAASLRRTQNALDETSLGTATLVRKNSSLVALRYTYGDQDGSSLRALVEASNSKSSSADAFKDAFMYAVGVDKKISQGAWLEFRVGRNRSVENGKEQTTALMNINISPTLFAFKK